MIKKYLILLLLFFSCLGFSQTNSVIGRWKVVAIDNGEVFYNAKTDSISIYSEDLKETYSEESAREYLIELMKKMYTDNHFEFDTKGIFKCEVYGAILESKYKNDLKRNVIIMESKNSLNEIVIDEMAYKFIDGQFYLTLNFTEPPGLYILEKEK